MHLTILWRFLNLFLKNLYKSGFWYYNLFCIYFLEETMENTRLKNTEKTRRLVALAILSALVIVLQILSNFIKFGPVQITLALVPIIIGAAMYGMFAGAYLGALLGVVILVSGLFGLDGGFMLTLIGINPVLAVALCILKTTLAGLAAGAVYKPIAKKDDVIASFVAGAVCPVVNTGLFIIVMFAGFIDLLKGFANGQNLIVYTITAFVGINFIVEFLVNMVLATVIARIIKISRKA